MIPGRRSDHGWWWALDTVATACPTPPPTPSCRLLMGRRRKRCGSHGSEQGVGAGPASVSLTMRVLCSLVLGFLQTLWASDHSPGLPRAREKVAGRVTDLLASISAPLAPSSILLRTAGAPQPLLTVVWAVQGEEAITRPQAPRALQAGSSQYRHRMCVRPRTGHKRIHTGGADACVSGVGRSCRPGTERGLPPQSSGKSPQETRLQGPFQPQLPSPEV